MFLEMKKLAEWLFPTWISLYSVGNTYMRIIFNQTPEIAYFWLKSLELSIYFVGFLEHENLFSDQYFSAMKFSTNFSGTWRRGCILRGCLLGYSKLEFQNLMNLISMIFQGEYTLSDVVKQAVFQVFFPPNVETSVGSFWSTQPHFVLV